MEYKHYLKIDTGTTDANGHNLIVRAFCNAHETAGGSDVEVTISDRIDSLNILPRQAHIFDYISNYSDVKKYVWDSANTQILEYTPTVAEYTETKIKEITSVIRNKIENTFTHTIDAVEYKISLTIEDQTNFDGLNQAANNDTMITQKLSCRNNSNGNRTFVTLNQAKINTLYDAAYTHKKNILDRFNTFKENAIGSATLADVDTEFASLKTDLGL